MGASLLLIALCVGGPHSGRAGDERRYAVDLAAAAVRETFPGATVAEASRQELDLFPATPDEAIQTAQRSATGRARTGSQAAQRPAPAKPRFDPSVSHDFDGRVETGYDSNPLKLNNNVSGAVFGEVKLGYEIAYQFAPRQQAFAGGEIDVNRYDVGEADRDAGRVSIGLRDTSLRLGRARLRTTLGAAYGFETMTFIDQATGAEETVAGRPVGDRFDVDWYEIFARLRAEASESTTLSLDVAAKFQDYRQDYTNLGLDNLDYSQYSIEPGLERELGGGFSARIDVPLSVRVYDDRRAEDLSGNDIPGSDLRYYYFGLDASLSDRVSKRLHWTLGAKGERRLDNESGFNDRFTYGVYGRITFGPGDGARFSVDAEATRREYDERDVAAINEANDGGRVKQGVRARLTYVYPVALSRGNEIDLYARGGGDIFENSDQAYEYTRFLASVGLRKKF